MKMMRFPKTYIVTTAQNGAAPFKPFLESLESCAKFYNAEILILETNGSETTSRRGIDSIEKEVLDPYLKKNYRLINEELSLNDGIQIRHFPVKAQQMIPFTSFERFVPPGKASIMASPKQMLLCRPH